VGVVEERYAPGVEAGSRALERVEAAENTHGVVDSTTLRPRSVEPSCTTKHLRRDHIPFNTKAVVVLASSLIAHGGHGAYNPEVELGVEVAVALVAVLVVVDSDAPHINLHVPLPRQVAFFAVVDVATDRQANQQHLKLGAVVQTAWSE
jgi:hypothetical protein